MWGKSVKQSRNSNGWEKERSGCIKAGTSQNSPLVSFKIKTRHQTCFRCSLLFPSVWQRRCQKVHSTCSKQLSLKDKWRNHLSPLKCEQNSPSYSLDTAFPCPGNNFAFLSNPHISLVFAPKMFNANTEYTIDISEPWMKPQASESAVKKTRGKHEMFKFSSTAAPLKSVTFLQYHLTMRGKAKSKPHMGCYTVISTSSHYHLKSLMIRYFWRAVSSVLPSDYH